MLIPRSTITAGSAVTTDVWSSEARNTPAHTTTSVALGESRSGMRVDSGEAMRLPRPAAR